MVDEPKTKALNATRAIGIPDEGVKPILKQLLRVYDNDWTHIAEDNYRTLLDAYFEQMENKGKEDNYTRRFEGHDGSRRPAKRQNLNGKEECASPALTRSREETDSEVREPSLIPSRQGTMKSSQPRLSGSSLESKPLAHHRDQKPKSSRELPVRLVQEPMNQPSCSLVRRENVPNELHQKGLAKLNPDQKRVNDLTLSKKPNSMTHPVNLGLSKSLASKQSTDGSSASNHSGIITTNLKIASSPMGEVKILLNCDSALGQPNFQKPRFGDVLQFIDEKYARSNKLVGDQFSVQKLLKDLCESYLKLGLDSSNHSLEMMRDNGLSKSLASKQSTDGSSASNHHGIIKTNLKIACSSMGEVKILLNCDSALGQPSFQKPRFGDVLQFIEEKYARSNKIVGDQFSVQKLLKDLCEIYLKVGFDSSDHPPEMIRETGNAHALHAAEEKKRPLSLGFAGNRTNSFECRDTQPLIHDKKRPFKFLKDITKGTEKVKFLKDITKGTEKVKISLVDDIGDEALPKFNYIPQNIIFQNANINISLARIADEDCCSSCSGDCLAPSIPCACARETGGEFAYTPQGLLKEQFLRECMTMQNEPQERHFVYCKDCPLEKAKNDYSSERCKGHLTRKFIKECWRKCGCDMQCGNRVVQRGISCKLQVFLTREGKGWGLRPLEALPKGTFVCEYIGEVLTNTELYERNMGISKERHTYPVTLDADWGTEGILRDEEALCLDATFNGNVARFINHRCSDANLVDVPVEVETPDHHYYHLAFFTTREVAASEELTWDYGIDFDDIDHPIEAFSCSCGSERCRDKKKKGRL